MALIAYVFLKLQTMKDMFRQMFKSPRFRESLESEHLKASQTLMKSPQAHVYHIF